MQMAKTVSKEEREKIVKAYQSGLGTVEYIARIFQINTRSVYRYLKQYKETGDLSPKKHTGRPPVINEENKKLIETIVIDNPDWILEEYRDKFYKITEIYVTISTIHYICKELNQNRKKKVSLLLSKKEKM